MVYGVAMPLALMSAITGASAMAVASARRCDALRPAAAASGAQLLQPNYLFEGVRRSKGRSGPGHGGTSRIDPPDRELRATRQGTRRLTDPSEDIVTSPAHYGQNQNASSTTTATVVCIASGMSIVNRFIGSDAASSARSRISGQKGRSDRGSHANRIDPPDRELGATRQGTRRLNRIG